MRAGLSITCLPGEDDVMVKMSKCCNLHLNKICEDDFPRLTCRLMRES